MGVSGEELRAVMRRWATGVTVVTTSGPEGRHGITVNSFTSLSLDPPLCVICIDKRARAHAAIPHAGGFTVNVLSDAQTDVSERFANRRPDLADPFEGLELTPAPSGAPVFAGALGYLDCTLEAEFPGGDHTIYVGRVQHAATLSDARPLLFFGGRYRHLAD
jgi:flavin reductase (DIM6/NTAB) family NADH-FMN oxidoreductase RutF